MAKRRNKNKKAGPVKLIRPGDLNPSPVAEATTNEPDAIEDASAPVVDEGSETVAAAEEQVEHADAVADIAHDKPEPVEAAADEAAGSNEAIETADATESADTTESAEAVEPAQSPEPFEEFAAAEHEAEPLPEFEDASALLAQSVPADPHHEIAARPIESIPIEAADFAETASAEDPTADGTPAMATGAEPAQAEPQSQQPSGGGGGKSRKDRKLKLNKLQKHARSNLEPLSEAPQEVVPEPEPEPVAPAEAERQGPSEPRIAAFAKLTEYQTLSLAHVAGIPEEADLPGHWRGVGFAISGRRLVTAFDEVVEIIRVPTITHVPGTQAWMLGVANVRGTLLPVVDLKQFLEGERTVMYEGQRVMVVRQSGGNVAVLIDQLYGQRAFNDSQKVAAVADGGTRYGHFIKQLYRVGDNDWGVFSMSMLTRTPEFRQAAA